MIYGHGDDLYRYNNIKFNFSSNVQPGGMSAGLMAYLKEKIADCSSYPEPKANDLERLIESKNNLPKGSVLVTNGAVEAFYLVAAWKRKHRSLIFIPSFSEYEDACCLNNHTLEFKSNAEFSKTDFNPYDLVWICNPNNPDGKIYKPNELKNNIKRYTNTFFIIDEAYIDFIKQDISLLNLVHECKNLMIIRSLTKRFSIPGLRLGYIMAAPDVISELEKGIIPWRINLLAQKAGLYCLSNEHSDNFNLNGMLEESERLQKEINKVKGFSVKPSDTTFFLVKSQSKASEMKNILAEKYGILIRDASNFKGLSENHFRISSQFPEQNNELIKALKEWN
jgi:threonine-phosphate decarboxylase